MLHLQKKHLKLTFSIFLSITILIGSCSRVLTYITFKINQTEIAKTICVMRAAKNNTCQGHCALKKELKKQAENEQKHNSQLKEKNEIVYINSISKYTFTTKSYKYLTKPFYFHLIEKTETIVFPIFHPPSA